MTKSFRLSLDPKRFDLGQQGTGKSTGIAMVISIEADGDPQLQFQGLRQAGDRLAILSREERSDQTLDPAMDRFCGT